MKTKVSVGFISLGTGASAILPRTPLETVHWPRAFTVLMTFLLGASCVALAYQNYSQQVFFENSLSPGSYFYSLGQIGTQQARPGRREVAHRNGTVHQWPQRPELQWLSMPNGGWDAEIDLYAWRNRIIDFPGDSLFLGSMQRMAFAPQTCPGSRYDPWAAVSQRSCP